MPKIKQAEETTKENCTPDIKVKDTAHYLDKLEHPDTATSCKGYRASRDTLKSRAKYKAFAVPLMDGLIAIESPLNKQYRLTRGFCSRVLLHQGNRIVSRYCGYRWCPVCSRIRTAKYINGYLPVIEQMSNPYLVTLTNTTCKDYQLIETIEDRNYKWSMILKYHKTLYNRGKIDFKLIGIRRLEITPRPEDMYHVHFHLVVDGKDTADFIKAQWLYRYPKADRRFQDIRRADGKTLLELFKYVTKFWTFDKDTGLPIIFTAKQMDTIFRAIRGKRTVNTFGGIRLVAENIEKIESMEYEDIEPMYDVSVWTQAIKDWMSTYGELISGYEPSEDDMKIFNSIKAEK
jgi:hypothetical protein